MKTRADTKISLRRSSRTTQSSKSSPSTLQKSDTSTKSHDVECKKGFQTDSNNIPESKDSDVKPEFKISPSLGRKRNDGIYLFISLLNESNYACLHPQPKNSSCRIIFKVKELRT